MRAAAGRRHLVVPFMLDLMPPTTPPALREGRYAVRPATADDAHAAADVIATAFRPHAGLFPESAAMTPAAFALLLQTGHAFLLALEGERVVAAVRYWADEGIGWFDTLASVSPGSGRALVRAAGRRAQDRGLRLVRARIPDQGVLPDALGRLGYLPIGRDGGKMPGEPAWLLVERRVPLLTVREQRRSDAAAIGALTGEDPWIFEQGGRPGWFVLADGERVAGVIGVRDGGAGLGLVGPPALDTAYHGRRLELWMVSRAATYAETHGYHSATVPASPELDALQRDLEDAYWQREAAGDGAHYVRRFTGRALDLDEGLGRDD